MDLLVLFHFYRSLCLLLNSKPRARTAIPICSNTFSFAGDRWKTMKSSRNLGFHPTPNAFEAVSVSHCSSRVELRPIASPPWCCCVVDSPLCWFLCVGGRNPRFQRITNEVTGLRATSSGKTSFFKKKVPATNSLSNLLASEQLTRKWAICSPPWADF